MKINKRWIIAGLVVIVITGFAAGLAFYSAGRWLKTADTLESADAIVVLAGMYERTFYAADLFRQGYGKEVYVSRPIQDPGQQMVINAGINLPSSESIHRLILEKKGVPGGNILFFGKGSISTVEEAQALRELFKNGKSKLLIVTSPYHIRRSRIIFKNIFDHTDVRCIVVGTPYEAFPESWWTDQNAARNVLLELVKLMFYQTGGRFISTDRKTMVDHPM